MTHTKVDGRRTAQKRPDGSACWWVNSNGYVEGRVWINGKPVNKRQHRYVMEMHINRALLLDEDVHHINGIKTDNRIENLEIISHGEHTARHNLSRTYKRGYTPKLSESERERRRNFAISTDLAARGRAALAEMRLAKGETK